MNKLITLLFLFVVSAGLKAQNQSIDRIIAVVGDKAILYSEAENQRLQAEDQGINLGKEGRMKVLDQLLFQYLLLYNAQLDSVEVSEAQIQNQLEARIKYFENQIGGKAKLEEFYGKSVQEIKEEYYDVIKDKLLSEAMERQITGDVRVTPAEVRKFFESIPTDSLPFINSSVEYAQICIVPKVSDAEKKREREKLEKVRKAIISGESTFCFEALDSKDPGTNTRCGEWDFIPRKVFVPEFDAWAFRLKDGEYSEVFETSFGFHFMQLIQRRGEEYRGRHILYVPKVTAADMRKASDSLEVIYQMVNTGKITFEKAAINYSQDADSKNNGGKVMNMNTGDTQFEINELEPQLFITLDRMKPGDVSRPVAYTTPENKQGYRIIKLLKRSDPHRANLTDDYQLIQRAAQADKERKALEAWVAAKIPATYIWLAEEFRAFTYNYPWVKKV